MTQYKLNDEELDAIVEEWREQWKFLANEEKLSNLENGLLADVLKYQDETNDLEDEEKSQDEASSTTRMK